MVNGINLTGEFIPIGSDEGIRPDVELYGDLDTFTFESDPAVTKAVKLLRN